MSARRVTGFSLIELMVAMAVMGFLMMAVSPSVTEWIVNLRIRNAADSLQAGLQTARTEAVRRNQRMTFWLIASPNPGVLGTDCTVSSSGASWVVSVSTPAGACNSAPSTSTAPMLVAAQAVGEGSSSSVAVSGVLADTTTAASSVAFDGLGRVSSTSTTPLARIDIKFNGSAADAAAYRSLRLLVGSAGVIRMCDPAVSAANDPRKC